jgi:hypothetical protein
MSTHFEKEDKQTVAIMAAIIFAVRDGLAQHRDPENGCAGGYSESVEDADEILSRVTAYQEGKAICG